MCAIFGIGLLPGHNIDYAVLQSIVTRLALAAQIRGRHATGLAFTTNKEISIFKHNVHASQFVELAEYTLELKRFLTVRDDDPLLSILGHCRHQTKGSHTNPLNNHPIETGHIVGTHNGVISNDDHLFDKFKDSIKRKAQVDSEVIFALINHFSKTYGQSEFADHPTTKALTTSIDKITGSMACAMVDARSPSNIWIWRNNNPVDIRYFRKEGLFIWATTATIIRDAIELTELSDPETITLDYDEGLCFNLEYGTYYQFDCSRLDDKVMEHSWSLQ